MYWPSSQSICPSRARDAGLQLTYTMVGGAISSRAFTALGFMPARGGSVMTTSGAPKSAISFRICLMSFRSSLMNSQLSISCRFAFSRASFTELSTSSTPSIFLQWLDAKSVMDPVPQKRS